MNSSETTLRAIIDRIIPADQDPGALDLGTERFVIERLAAEPGDAELIDEGLTAFERNTQASEGQPFVSLGAERQDILLQAISDEPWLARLVVLVSEGFYADPGNGGNHNAGSWTMIGYQHRLPEGPSGPPAKAQSGSSTP